MIERILPGALAVGDIYADDNLWKCYEVIDVHMRGDGTVALGLYDHNLPHMYHIGRRVVSASLPVIALRCTIDEAVPMTGYFEAVMTGREPFPTITWK